MSDKVFLDTNIFIYSFDKRSLFKREKAIQIINNVLKEGNGTISYQVIQEFINVATKKFQVPLSYPDCKFYCNKILFPLWGIYSSKELYNSALEISERWKYSFYDSLIIAAALESNCTFLLSEDLQNEQKIFSLQIINPFLQ